MDNLTGSMKDVAFATSPREFDLSYSTTLEEIMEKLNARRAAFQMPFQIKGGIPGQRISFEKEPNVDVGLWLFLKDGTHIRIQPVITEAKMSVGGMRVDKNSALRKGLKGATVGLATERGAYIDTVTETVKKILNGEEVEDYVAPEVPVETKDWLTTFLLCLFCGGLGVHRYYVGKIGTGILYTLTAVCSASDTLSTLSRFSAASLPTRTGILSSAKRNEESKMAQVCTAVFCRNDMLFSIDRQICASLKDIGREL